MIKSFHCFVTVFYPLFFLISLSFIPSFSSYSQDKIILISGQIIDGRVLSVNEDTIRFQYPKKNKIKEGFVEAYRVFSIQYADGNEKVIYKYDTLTANDRTEEEIRNFIAGEQDALQGYKGLNSAFIPLVISGAGAFVIKDNFLIIAVPFVTYMTYIALTRPRIIPSTVRDPKLLSSPDYVEGYKRIARSRKNRNALWGSILGAGMGLGAYIMSKDSF